MKIACEAKKTLRRFLGYISQSGSEQDGWNRAIVVTELLARWVVQRQRDDNKNKIGVFVARNAVFVGNATTIWLWQSACLSGSVQKFLKFQICDFLSQEGKWWANYDRFAWCLCLPPWIKPLKQERMTRYFSLEILLENALGKRR